MALKSVVVVQHRKIIPFRRRVLFLFFFCLRFLNNVSDITRIASVNCKQIVASVKLVYTLIDGDLTLLATRSVRAV